MFGVAYTVGHSTRSQREFLALLSSAGVDAVADVRAFPGSRRHPQFNREALIQWLTEAGVAYQHLPSLGGRRRPREGSLNGGWREPAFQGYADHMDSAEFAEGVAQLQRLAGTHPTAVMCAEALWWRCHRRLVADALLVRGWRVEHLGIKDEPVPHELTEFSVPGADGRSITYPPPQQALL